MSIINHLERKISELETLNNNITNDRDYLEMQLKNLMQENEVLKKTIDSKYQINKNFLIRNTELEQVNKFLEAKCKELTSNYDSVINSRRIIKNDNLKLIKKLKERLTKLEKTKLVKNFDEIKKELKTLKANDKTKGYYVLESFINDNFQGFLNYTKIDDCITKINIDKERYINQSRIIMINTLKENNQYLNDVFQKLYDFMINNFGKYLDGTITTDTLIFNKEKYLQDNLQEKAIKLLNKIEYDKKTINDLTEIIRGLNTELDKVNEDSNENCACRLCLDNKENNPELQTFKEMIETLKNKLHDKDIAYQDLSKNYQVSKAVLDKVVLENKEIKEVNSIIKKQAEIEIKKENERYMKLHYKFDMLFKMIEFVKVFGE